MKAYSVNYDQISGPAWIESARYDIVATVRLGTTSAQINQMLRNLLTERFNLAFHHETKGLPLYELSVGKHGPKFKPSLVGAAGAENYGNSVAPSGSQAAGPGPSTSNLQNDNGFMEIPAERTTGLWQMINRTGRVRVVGRNQPISELISAIGNQAGRPVVDRTGLSGKYDFVLEYALVVGAIGSLGMPMRAPTELMSTDKEADPPPALTTAIEEQLGLRLKAKKGPLDVMVIDHAERMPEN